MRLHRIFIAIHLPDSVKTNLLAYKDKWAELPARWIKPENLHLTLLFLGNTSEAELQQLIELCKGIGEQHMPFRLQITHLQYGPDASRPRMIWATIEKSSELFAIQRDAQNALENNGLLSSVPERRTFSPHLTLARLRMFELARMEQEELPAVNEKLSLSFPVKSFEIMESALKRSGAEYTALQSFMLQR